MAYIVYSIRGEEIGRRALNGPIVIGRAPDCDVRIHDIRLSRHHCRLEPSRGGWTVIDLGSRNGTHVNGRQVARHGLRDGDALMAGNALIHFHMGKLEPAPARAAPAGRGPVNRPLDPHEALAGTVTGFAFDAEYAEVFRKEHNLPIPRPVPPEPASYAKEDVYGMLNEIASSSWDSIYAGASRPVSRLSGDTAGPSETLRARPRARAESFDPRLQAPSPVRPKRPALPPPVTPPSRFRRALRAVARPLVAARRWVAPPGSFLVL